MKTIADYQDSIKIIHDERNNTEFWIKLSCKLAEVNPQLFVSLAHDMADKSINKKTLSVIETKKITDEAIRIAKYEGKVAAIKFLRAKLGLGLKEAKEMIEDLTTEFYRSN